MKNIYQFGLDKEQLRNIRQCIKSEYKKMDEKQKVHRMVLAKENAIQHWINDFFKLNEEPF